MAPDNAFVKRVKQKVRRAYCPVERPRGGQASYKAEKRSKKEQKERKTVTPAKEFDPMRMSSLAILLSVGAGTLMALRALTTIAWAVQDQPVTIGTVEMVCTGVGSAKDNPAWSIYPVKLTFSNLAGEYETAGHVVITQGGKTVMESDCDAPWLLIKAPPGNYDVHAALPGSNRVANASFTTGTRGGQQTVNLAFPGGKQAANAMPSDAGAQQQAAYAMPKSLLPVKP
jgi:hypothetical protein